ncbi:hypothetical protein HELRODRAFT_171076 [Helobdella robusta]|uniref:Uncharacterized protein n=1 Tax=Helobdella robusta TaxID=6412 RepID=T1F3S6_HELRO|nr:hypothetical protein HELRODRAFT_171076 [Helobdella robusta]ESO07034.1 hypothetical protein HELRODRAFT_171076 [Helobdella robusta]
METLKNGLENAKYIAEQSYEKCSEIKSAMKQDRKGWLVCLAVLIITVIRSGLTYSFGMFIVKLQSIYNSSMAEQIKIHDKNLDISKDKGKQKRKRKQKHRHVITGWLT